MITAAILFVDFIFHLIPFRFAIPVSLILVSTIIIDYGFMLSRNLDSFIAAFVTDKTRIDVAKRAWSRTSKASFIGGGIMIVAGVLALFI